MKVIYVVLAPILMISGLFLSCKKDRGSIDFKPKGELQDTVSQDTVGGIFTAIKKNTDSLYLLPFIGKPLDISSYDGANQSTHPSIIYFPNKWKGWKLWMVHTPYPFSKDFYENPSIAVSNDGVNWSTPSGLINPLDFCGIKENQDKYHYSDGELVFREDLQQMECWYRYSKNAVLEEIWRRTSKDGKTWTQKELMIKTDANSVNMVLSPTVLWEDGKYRVWSVAADPFRVEYRESINGKDWTKPVSLKLSLAKNIAPWHIEVKKNDSGYEMLLDVFNVWNKDPHTKFLMTSKSQDGVNWGEFRNSMKASEKKDHWNGKMIYRSSFIKVEGLYIVYYSAMAFDSSWGIGIAMGNSLDNLVY
ncbi:hypothetical protein [Sphingobacterium siyangense]|uniref:hypothetical protein n=1 Tax=Sphingobacterium siyangense TaxID=459529 RepID=UPI003DA3428C